MNPTDTPEEQQPRHHTDAPAEGQPEGWKPEDEGAHTQDPAEGGEAGDDGETPPSDA
ncbi:MAG: hypothetical protein J0I04_00630 [Paenarthrobacter ureafaciens]|uniref:hypothetical protein n=1 Tax=Paenarthrobacter ureafaciens TaxID=37931 RepID=UPI001AC31315|nr:hypothetical protein [Paenarthrobacter ureafaciens]MBN9128146.1 hypothetical protein [Paenarthrobacter ureafaciens]